VNVLIIYGTTEGQTRKIAERAGARVRERGHDVEIHNSASLAPALDLAGFHAIIVAASVHQERHQDHVSDFVMAHREQMNSKPTAFISVSLSAVLEYAKDEARTYVDRFLTATHWQPQNILLLGGALRGSEYDYFERQIIKFIVMKRGEIADMTRDYEFTDWNALAGFIDEFLAAAEPSIREGQFKATT
jgi:menaquinone-dependent protoporphyrinogen oxidase